MDKVLNKTWKTWFLANFWHFSQNFGKTRFFSENLAPSVSNCHEFLTSCKKSDNSYDSIPRKIRTYVRTYVRTDGSEFIGPSRKRGSNMCIHMWPAVGKPVMLHFDTCYLNKRKVKIFTQQLKFQTCISLFYYVSN